MPDFSSKPVGPPANNSLAAEKELNEFFFENFIPHEQTMKRFELH